MSRASSSACSSSNALNRKSTRARCGGVTADQAGNAARAARMAARVSSADASATRALTSPVAGLNTGAEPAASPATARPSMKCPNTRLR